VGRHRAAHDAEVHPLVAEALARRAAGPARALDPEALDPEKEPGEGGIGWPAPAKPGGGGLGWPGDLDHASDDALRDDAAVRDAVPAMDGAPAADASPAEGGAPAAERRGVWRRLFGARPAA
jgi:hypothetical protein